jgi:23S rRNA (guanosine2251-2'-O)-methyltransferase
VRRSYEDEPTEAGDSAREPGRIVYGLHPIAETLRARADEIEHLFVVGGRVSPRVQAIIDAARAAGVSLRFVDRERLRLLCGTTDHQGVVARVATFAYAALEDVLAAAASASEKALLLALDGVQDPRNLGAVLRSAEALGAHGVVLPRERAAGVTPTAAKVAAGAAERIPIARVTNLVRSLEEMKRAGLWIVGAAMDAPQTAATYDFKGPSCVVIGGEEKGLRPLVARACDSLVRIPLAGTTASLNASIAAAIVLYEARRQRSGA